MEPLVSPDEFAGYLQRDLDRYSANLAIQGASGVIRAFCGWGLTRAVETLTVDGNGAVSLNLPTLKINDVTAVRIDDDPLDASGYKWAANGILCAASGTRWPIGPRRIEADVDHGYNPIPDELRIVCCSIAARLYSNPEALSQKSSGDNSRSFGHGLLEIETRVISAHRLT